MREYNHGVEATLDLAEDDEDLEGASDCYFDAVSGTPFFNVILL